MERTELFKRDSQRGLLWWIPVVAAALIVVRIISLQFGSEAKSGGGGGHDAAATRVRWVSIGEARKLAAESNKPIMYDFSAEWCGPCKQLDRLVFADTAFAARINERFIAVKVMDRRREEGRNRPDVAELQRRYQVHAFPTVVFADARGNEIAREEGFGGADEFAKLIESIPR